MLPFPIKPMLLQIAREPFNSPEYLFEWKVDGIRCIMFYENGKVRLQSKNGKDCTAAFPELCTPPINAEAAVLDGEITVLIDGKPDFEAVMERYMAGSKKVSFLVVDRPAVYIVWDILFYKKNTIINLALNERKQLLDNALENSNQVKKIDWVDGDGVDLWEGIKSCGLEGIVAKKKKSQYEFRRSHAWLKIKNYREATVNVFGYAKRDEAVLVGIDDRIQGHAIGLRGKEKIAFCKLLEQYGLEKGNNILLPSGIKGKVKFTTWTSKGNMRDCSWAGFAL